MLRLTVVFLGVFRPPVDGVYALTVYGLLAGSDPGDVDIQKNDVTLCHGHLFEHHFTATCTAIGELTTDDSVRVTGRSSNTSALRGASVSGFTGFLIYDS